MAWTAPRDWTAGELVTEAMLDTHIKDNLNYLNDLRVKYATQTSSSSSTSGTTVLDVLSAPSFTPISSSRLIKITAHWRSITGTVGTDTFEVQIREGSTKLNASNEKIQTGGTGQNGGTIVHIIASPSAAAHTYKLSIGRVAGTGTATVDGDATFPILIMVEDAGAA